MTLTLGYKASNEQFGPRELLELVTARGGARLRGLRRLRPPPAVAPQRRPRARASSRGSAPRRPPPTRIVLGTSVLTPTMRYHPAIIAQAFATLGCLAPGPHLPRRRHRRGDERDADHRRRVPRPQGAAAEDGRGDQGHQAALGARSASTSRASTTSCAAPRSTTGPTSRCRSTSRRPGRWRPSSPAASATASSAPPARTRSSTSTCWPTSRRAPRRRAATTSRSSA